MGVHGEADGGLVVGFIIAKTQHDIRNSLPTRRQIGIEVCAGRRVAHHAQTIFTQRAPAFFARAGVELNQSLVAAEQYGLDRIQHRRFSRSVRADECSIALDVNLLG
ncbi:hypothetical protein ABW22_05700 [Thiobacillus denitrificans]|uniref:Uncharacterized protein n=1 Tax=Thiobacillus denitrificans TaxID=36861 RepID=A0A106BQR8_THIDE|nr:hypothetical protein ABW22_05700 [Thiobacillus denitrificans]